MLVVGPVMCVPRDMFLCNGLPGGGGELATSDDKEAKMSVGLAPPTGGSCRGSSAIPGRGVSVRLRPAAWAQNPN